MQLRIMEGRAALNVAQVVSALVAHANSIGSVDRIPALPVLQTGKVHILTAASERFEQHVENAASEGQGRDQASNAARSLA